MKKHSLDVPKDMKNCSIMSGARSRHELTNQMNSIGNVRTGDSKIDETAQKLSI
jgi:hypothetical protein